MNEIRDYHLSTVGGAGMMMSGGAYLIGVWLIVTGYRLPGAVTCLSATAFLLLALIAFCKIGKDGTEERESYPKYEDTV